MKIYFFFYFFSLIGRIIGGIENYLTDCVIGTEFAGRRTDTGERVFGFCSGRGISTFVDVRQEFMTKIPEKWSMEESVTLLSTYCTVWYGLIDRAQLTKSMTFKKYKNSFY